MGNSLPSLIKRWNPVKKLKCNYSGGSAINWCSSRSSTELNNSHWRLNPQVNKKPSLDTFLQQKSENINIKINKTKVVQHYLFKLISLCKYKYFIQRQCVCSFSAIISFHLRKSSLHSPADKQLIQILIITNFSF